MRFIHISDVHLGMTPDKGKAWSGVRAKEIEDTFDKILAIAEERKVDLLLVAAGWQAGKAHEYQDDHSCGQQRLYREGFTIGDI